MKYGSLILEKKEFRILEDLLRSIQYAKDESYKGSMTKLAQELKSASIKEEEEFPDDVIRFNSMVEIESFDGSIRKYQLVRPEDSNVALNRISILAPLGAALIGYACNDEITWRFPSGEKRIKILSVENLHQPKNTETKKV